MHTPRVPRTYTREETDEILRRALAEQAGGGNGNGNGISHDDLVAAAREVGIPESAIETAASRLGEHKQVEERVERIRRQKRRAFASHLLSFLIVNGGLFLFDYADGGAWFFHYLMIIWGIVLLLLGIRQLAPDAARLTKRAERELEKERRQAERKRRLSTRGTGRAAIPGAAKEFEAAVQDGVSTLLSAAARAIRGATPEGRRYRADEELDDEPRAGSERSAEQRRRSGRI